MKKRVLVVAAHPDDETLGCGSTIAWHADRGDDVHILILGEGIRSRSGAVGSAQDLNPLRHDAHRAAAILGARAPILRSFSDNQFDTVSLLSIIKEVEKLIERIRPEIVYTHHPGDLNIDHRRMFEAVLSATRAMKGRSVKEVNCFYVPSASDWSFGHVGLPFKPNLFIDASKTLGRKIRAMEAYKTERRAFPHPRSKESLKAMAQHWGSMVGLPAAEAFEIVRTIR